MSRKVSNIVARWKHAALRKNAFKISCTVLSLHEGRHASRLDSITSSSHTFTVLQNYTFKPRKKKRDRKIHLKIRMPSIVKIWDSLNVTLFGPFSNIHFPEHSVRSVITETLSQRHCLAGSRGREAFANLAGCGLAAWLLTSSVVAVGETRGRWSLWRRGRIRFFVLEIAKRPATRWVFRTDRRA